MAIPFGRRHGASACQINAFDKCQEPVTTLKWIGVGYDSVKMLMFIDPDKIAEAITLCTQFLASDTISHKQLQKLLGKIFYIIRCSEAAKRFTSRLLDCSVWLTDFMGSKAGRNLVGHVSAYFQWADRD